VANVSALQVVPEATESRAASLVSLPKRFVCNHWKKSGLPIFGALAYLIEAQNPWKEINFPHYALSACLSLEDEAEEELSIMQVKTFVT